MHRRSVAATLARPPEAFWTSSRARVQKPASAESRARHESPPGGAESGFTVLAESLRITGA